MVHPHTRIVIMPTVTPKLLAFADPEFSWLLYLNDKVNGYTSREATQPPGRYKPKTGASSSRKEFAPFRANSSLQSSTPVGIVTMLRKTTGSHTSILLSSEEAQPSPSLRPLQPRTKSNMSPRGENRGPTDHEPTAPPS